MQGYRPNLGDPERFINDPSLIEISEFQGSIERLQVGDSNFQRETGERISRVSIKGRTKRKDKVSSPISILVSKRVFNRRHARTCIAHDMRRARIRAREFFRAVHWPFFFLSKTCLVMRIYLYSGGFKSSTVVGKCSKKKSPITKFYRPGRKKKPVDYSHVKNNLRHGRKARMKFSWHFVRYVNGFNATLHRYARHCLN